ncbi:MAG: septum formation initiator family protein [Deltaproteobacteria bacterium]|nr:septum formation initiator family protein [Deltaproteobacteria bacterium]
MSGRRGKRGALWGFRLLLAAALAVGIGYLPYHVYGPEGIGRVRRLENEHAALVSETVGLAKRNKELVQEIRELKSNRWAAERVARDELGLVRPSDLIFIFE